MDKKLKYTFSNDVVNFLLNALNKVQLVGVNNARNLVLISEMLQKPDNSEELEKETLEALKNKYENKSEKKDK